MTKPELIALLKLLSALETVVMMSGARLQDHLIEQLGDCVEKLEQEILK